MPAKDFRTAPAPLFEVQPRPRRASLLGSHSLPSLTPAARLQADLAAQQISQLLNQDASRRAVPPPHVAQSAPPHVQQPPVIKAVALPPLPEPLPELPEMEAPSPAMAQLAMPAMLRHGSTLPKERIVLRLPTSDLPLRLEKERDARAEAADAKRHELFRCCFWPLYVWKRAAKNTSVARQNFVHHLSAGLLRQRFWRFWAEYSFIHAILGRALRTVHTHLCENRTEEGFDRWATRWLSTRKCHEVVHGERFRKLQLRIILSAPFKVLWIYGHCRALVRRRSFGQYAILPEDLVPPLAFPYQARADELCAPLLKTATRKDVQRRTVNRFTRLRLSRPMLDSFKYQVQWRRKKRFSLARGWREIFRCACATAAAPSYLTGHSHNPHHSHQPHHSLHSHHSHHSQRLQRSHRSHRWSDH